MVRPATHLGGSGLEYKPNKVPNFLDDLDKQYSEDERILKQQHNYLRERDQQMVRKAQGEEQLAKALLQLAPKAFSAMKNSRESKIDQGTHANLDKPDFPATEEDTKRQIEWFTKGEDELLKDQAALGEEVGKMPYMETRNKVMNMHGIEKIAYQRALQIRMLQLSTPQAFEDAMEGDTDYHNGLNHTERYAFSNDGNVLDIDQFLKEVENKSITETELKKLSLKKENSDFSDAPYCIEAYLTENKTVQPGNRDNFLFQYSVYAKKKFGENFEEEVHKFHHKYF